jgi:hypothetical protein
MEEEIRKSIEIIEEIEHKIEDDVKEVEKNCSEINCNPIKRTIYSLCKLLYDILFFYKKCKNN